MAFVKCLLQHDMFVFCTCILFSKFFFFGICMLLIVQDLYILLRQCFYTYRSQQKMASLQLNILQKNSISYGAMTVDTGAYQQSKF